MSTENLDDLLKSKLEDFKQKAPQGAWSRIEKSRGIKPLGSWKVILSVAASLITVLAISFIIITNERETEPILAESAENDMPVQKEKTLPVPIDDFSEKFQNEIY